jgi:hypothetical protein
MVYGFRMSGRKGPIRDELKFVDVCAKEDTRSILRFSIEASKERVRQMDQKMRVFGTDYPQGAKLSSEAELKIWYHHRTVRHQNHLPIKRKNKNSPHE